MSKDLMNERYFRVVSLWLGTNDVAAFEAFERQAVKVMAKFDGRIEHAIRISSAEHGVDEPFEVHVVSFPNESAFQMYRQSPESKKLSEERKNLISKTVIHAGHEVTAYA